MTGFEIGFEIIAGFLVGAALLIEIFDTKDVSAGEVGAEQEAHNPMLGGVNSFEPTRFSGIESTTFESFHDSPIC